jgi:5-methyltetrahydropteroyltriglutamate--homocysteine methyltransferase
MTELRAEQVGSLLRPKALHEAREAFAAGRLDADGLRAAEDKAILGALAMQRETGIDVLTDGEFRRASWVGGFYDVVEGVTAAATAGAPARAWKGESADVANEALPITPFVVSEKLRVKGRFTKTEADFLKAHAGAPFKITMPSAALMFDRYQDGVSNAAYPTRQAMLDDLVAIYRRELEGLVADGVTYIQLDSLRYLDLIDGPRRERLKAQGLKEADVLAQLVAADSAVLAAAKKPGVTRAIHICRGNHRSAWATEGSYEPVAEQLFAEVDAERLLLEFDDARSGGFEPLRFVPKGKTVVLGLITTKKGALESQDALRRRVDEAARYVPLDYLAISPQCGFASTHLGNLLSEDDERRKLELVADTARKIWG